MSYQERRAEQVAFIFGFAFIASMVIAPLFTFVIINFR